MTYTNLIVVLITALIYLMISEWSDYDFDG